MSYLNGRIYCDLCGAAAPLAPWPLRRLPPLGWALYVYKGAPASDVCPACLKKAENSPRQDEPGEGGEK